MIHIVTNVHQIDVNVKQYYTLKSYDVKKLRIYVVSHYHGFFFFHFTPVEIDHN